MSRKFGLLATTLLLAGCGVTEIRTPGTADKDPRDLARVRVPVHHDGLRSDAGPAHLRGVEIDGVDYDLDGETRDFWLQPGEHDLHPRYRDCLHWPKSWFIRDAKGDVHINTLHLKTTGPPLQAQPGRSYALRCIPYWNSGPGVRVDVDEDP